MKNLKFYLLAIVFTYNCLNLQAQNAQLHVEGSFATAITTVTQDLTLDDSHQIVLVNSANQRTITLPSALGIAGRKYTIKKIGNGDVSITKQIGETIEGINASFLLLGINTYFTFVI